MSRALVICSEPGCGELTVRGRCADCEDAAARRYRVTHKRTADPADRHWRKIRANYLRKHGTCECDDCLALPEDQRPKATDVDHIVSREAGGSHKDENLRAMAHSHHSRRTARDQPGGWNALRR